MSRTPPPSPPPPPPFFLLQRRPHFLSPRLFFFSLLHVTPPRHPTNPPSPNPTKTQQQFHQWRQRYIAQTQKRETLFSHLKSCFSSTHLLQIHAQFIRFNFVQHPRLSLKFLSKASSVFPHDMAYICKVFTQFAEPGIAHYNAMIMAFSRRTDWCDDGIKFYKGMVRGGVVPDPLSVSFCLRCCVGNLGLVEGMQVHVRVLVGGYEKDSVLMTSLMSLYSVCGRWWDAFKVFDEMTKRDAVACNVMISCLMNSKRTRDALAVFDTMRGLQNECRPDDVTCLLLLQACADLGALEFGRRVRDYVEEHGYGESSKISNALVTMYSKCGCVDEAYQIFKKMPTKNLVAWSAMISGYAMNGRGRDAIEAFEEMRKMGIVPDDKAFTGVLYACSHSGLLDEGMAFFDRMVKEFGVCPTIHHYGCVVDILSRGGLLKQAYDLILSMEPKPDAKIWRTLLAACRKYKDFELAERVIEHLVELKAQEAGDYVLLLNTYSSNGKWDEVKELRKFMKENKIVTTPGCSTIELKGVVHEFVGDDISHPRKDEIYEMLREIKQQLKVAGYVPETSSELHNMHAGEKDVGISHHSEKLAIAFGILVTSPGTTIRVASSLRTCADCHNFVKVLSAVYHRKVIIRDQNRLHHFRGGHCSCGDFW